MSIESYEVLEDSPVIRSTGGPTLDDIIDLPITGAKDIAASSYQNSSEQGSILMSSGGTTGEPKLTWVSYHMSLERITRYWRPLNSGSVLLNLFNPGRLWGSHYYMQELARWCHSVVLPFGPASHDLAAWESIFRRAGVNALAGNPTVLAEIAQATIHEDVDLDIRDIIWMAEPMSTATRELIATAFPHAQLWGNYGSVDAWVIAQSWPECDQGILHLLDEQLIECRPDGALLSRRGRGWAVEAHRYDTGDCIVPASCGCGRSAALSVKGRAKEIVSLRSAIFTTDELLSVIGRVPGIASVQFIIPVVEDVSATGVPWMRVEFTIEGNTTDCGEQVIGSVREQLVRGLVHMGAVVRSYSDALQIRLVDQLSTIERTGKTPLVLRVVDPNV
jgi:phenylacetate-coenzyme A ligase PaaK-like adenylate-forming protein